MEKLLDLNELEKHSDIIFLPYVDKQFNKVKEFKGFVWDIWFQVEGRNVIRNTNEIKSKKNKTYYILKK